MLKRDSDLFFSRFLNIMVASRVRAQSNHSHVQFNLTIWLKLTCTTFPHLILLLSFSISLNLNVPLSTASTTFTADKKNKTCTSGCSNTIINVSHLWRIFLWGRIKWVGASIIFSALYKFPASIWCLVMLLEYMHGKHQHKIVKENTNDV
jgi:hypothetical protein